MKNKIEIENRIIELDNMIEKTLKQYKVMGNCKMNDNPVNRHDEIIIEATKRKNFLKLYLEEIIK